MHSKLIFLSRAVSILLMFAPLILFSQLVAPKTTVDSSFVAQPQAIPVINIIQRISEANKNLKLAERKLKPSSDLRKIDSLFPIYKKFIEEQKLLANEFTKANPNRQKINNLIVKWNSYGTPLKNWESLINEYEGRILRLAGGISYDVQTWKLTYENAVSEKVPSEVLAKVKKVWKEIEKTQKSIENENNKLLKLESRIYEQNTVVNKVVEDLITLKTSDVYDLFYLRHQPLWKESFKVSENTKRRAPENESISDNVNGALKFVEANENIVYLFFIAIVLIVLLLIFVKKAYVKHAFNEEDGDLQNAKDIILNHSVVGGLFLSMMMAKLFFNNAPTVLSDTLILLLLIASVPLVQPSMYKRFKKIIYFGILFYILDTVKTYFWFNSFNYRIYLLIEVLFVIAILFIFTYPYLKTRKMKIGRFGLFLIRLTPVIYGLSVVSLLSNILGYTNLADLALKVCIQGGVTIIIFYGILLIFGGITVGLIHHYYSGRPEVDLDKKLMIEKKSLKVIRVIAFIYWIIVFLKMLDQLRPINEYLTDVLTDPYQIGTTSFTLGAILTFIIILAFSFLITSFISFIFGGAVTVKFIKLPKGIPAAISLVIRYFIIAFGFVLALSALGIDLSKFNLMAGALGLGIGFGLQEIISNFISGLILVFERPILIGDTVEVDNLLGTVSRIGVRSSSISTFDGAEVVVPNNNLITNDLINWTLTDNIKRVEILIGTNYGSDPNKILKILTDVTNKYKDALKNPIPHALFSEFGDNSLNFKVRFWVPYEIGLQAKSDVSVAIYDRFKEEGIQIPFPQQDVYIKELPSKS